MPLYLPPDYHASSKPLIFLAGPIQGAPRWQNAATNLLDSPAADIASPRYIGDHEEEIGDWVPGLSPEQQIGWETYHLTKAGEKGVILFWLSREETHYCNRAFAQTTRFELGEWKQRHLANGARLVVGIDPSFPGGGYIQYRLSQECPGIPIRPTLESACTEVLELIRTV